MNLIQFLTDQQHMKELLTPGDGHHGIGDERGLVMKKTEDSPLRSPKRTPDLAFR